MLTPKSSWALCFSIFALGVGLTATKALGQSFRDPEHFWTQQSAYAGAQACQGCHTNLYDTQDRSNHARSLRPISEIGEILSLLPFQMKDRIAQAELRLEGAPESKTVLTASKDRNQQRLILDWAFGGGSKGITPIGRLENGQFVESRLSWYADSRSFDLTPGATQQTPRTLAESLGRALSEEERMKCFGCHTTGSTQENPLPSRQAMGIRCERCHGPGLEHIRAMGIGLVADKKIFHPGRLDGFAQAQLCGVCHGRPPADNDLAAIHAIQERALTVRFPSQRLVLSRCFNETEAGLKCTTCHDPHANVAVTASAYDKACLECHKVERRKMAAVCPVSRDKCSSCHMPKQRVMLHSEFADHWIRISPESFKTRKAQK
ncbi:MAG: hypothetical protein L0387_27020 [Acidobacteria bacterium]|nr:hypothetical protein [Acidobacteriota bacterium]MCI0625253.1 hypothetical protein [Acidobacteriota bacterium]MCI0718792.1 hypothetical protein [Acidobacteriota bacterium]